MAGAIIGSVTDDAAKLAQAAENVTRSTWSSLIDKGKAFGKIIGGANFANQLRQILSDDSLSPSEKLAKLNNLSGYDFSMLPDLLPKDIPPDAVFVIGAGGVLTMVPPQWVHDP